ncbi:malonyl CoA-ACP transacylase [Mycobacterium tuberculosis]|nr:malonyl CoA-ACP transacylase [Mycobacterium tuberculosis]
MLADPLARALFAAVTARVAVTDDAVADYHARNPLRFAAPCPGQHGWRAPAAAAPPLDQVRRAITEHLLGGRAPPRLPGVAGRAPERPGGAGPRL